MKKYMFFALCTINMYGMEKPIQREAREWDPLLYIQGNTLQITSFLNFLKKNNINTDNKKIISIGCGTGEIENELAKKAQYIHGIDASKKMIEYAQQHSNDSKNISFEHCFAEDFISEENYDLALASFALHWIEGKEQTIKRISDCLEINGEFFAVFQTSNNGIPLNLAIFTQMFPIVQEMIKANNNTDLPSLNDTTMQPILGSSYPSIQDFTRMVENAGFEIIKNEEQIYESKMTKEEIKSLQKPIMFSRPCMQSLTTEQKELFLNTFVDEYISRLEKTKDNIFKEKHRTTVLHARKIK